MTGLENMLPKVTAEMFLEEGVDLGDYKGTMIYSVKDDLKIRVELHTWMESTLENHQVKYEISFVWNGKKFEVKRKPVSL